MANKTISIIIPYFNEREDELFPLLASINNQVGIDFSRIECLLVCDGTGNEMPEEYLGLFKNLTIRTVMMDENRGPGVARQVGIDHAGGEYLLFCDADDVLHNVAVLGAFLAKIDIHAPDIITSVWLEELADGQGGFRYLTHEDEATWMHGKAIRRAYLQTRGIRFHDELRVHEDSYFLALAFAQTASRRKLLVTSYIWRYRPESITRRNEAAYTFEAAPIFIDAVTRSFAKLEKMVPHEMPYRVAQLMAYHYFSLHTPHWQAEGNEGHVAEAEKTLCEKIAPFWHYFTQADGNLLTQVYNEERVKHPVGIEEETFGTWITRIWHTHEG